MPVALLCALLLYLVPAGLAQTVELQINNPPSSNVLDGIYVGSYSANNLTSGGTVQITCDDFKDNSDFNAANYTTNTFSSLGNTLWGGYLMSSAGGGLSLTQVTTLYEEAAWLTLGMLGQTGTQQGYSSYAIWAIFDASDVASWLTSYGDSGACNAVFGAGSWAGGKCTASTTNKGGLVEQAEAEYSNLNTSNILILTPQGCKSGSAGSPPAPGSCPEQEFFEVVDPVPEGGTAAGYLLLAGFACFGAMFFRSRLQAAGGTIA